MSLGPLIVVSGPSGSGKSTLIARALTVFGPAVAALGLGDDA